MRAIIIGAGIAGTVAGMALRRAGFEPEIFEAYDESAGLDHGVFLTVAVNGLDALRAVGADHVVTSAGFASERIEFFSGTGRRLGAVALGPTLPDGTVTQTIRRSDLYHGMYREAVRRGVPVRHGKRLVDAKPRAGGGVVARFADGSSVEGDVLIGADGVHSATRTLIDKANPAPRYTGLGNTGGFSHVADPRAIGAAPGDYRMIWGRHCFFGYVVRPGGEVWWFANPPSRAEPGRAELRATTPDALRDKLIAMLAADRGPATDIVRATTGPVRLTNQYDLPAVPAWHNGAMVVIGDAAHAVSPSSGQGCSLACEDAVILARCLRDAPTVPRALDRYEVLRRARVERVVAWGSRMNSTKQPGPVARLARDLVLPFILRNATGDAAVAKQAWMFEHHIDWDRPIRAAGRAEPLA